MASHVQHPCPSIHVPASISPQPADGVPAPSPEPVLAAEVELPPRGQLPSTVGRLTQEEELFAAEENARLLPEQLQGGGVTLGTEGAGVASHPHPHPHPRPPAPAWMEYLRSLNGGANGLTSQQVGIAVSRLWNRPVKMRNSILSMEPEEAVAFVLDLIQQGNRNQDQAGQATSSPQPPPAASYQLPSGTMLLHVALKWLEHCGLYPASPSDTARSDQQSLQQKKHA